ncbi:hypothetical protein BDF14DRAFT_321236 [Spinellus fusiger]|nr:hypothetical protein BDF14DRAFT_321236 [Spinellus fusiger]
MLNYSYSLSQIHNDHQTHPNHPYFQNYPSYVSQILSNAEYQPQSQSYYSSRSRSHCSVASFVDPIFSKGASSTTAYNQKENESYSSVQTQYYPQEQAYYNSHVYVQDAFSTGQNMYSSVGLPSKQTLSHYAYPSTTWENPTVLPLGDNPDFYQLQDSPEKPQRYNPWPEKPRSNPETPTSLSLELQVEKTMIAQNPQNSRKNKKQDFKTESPLVEKQEIPIGLPSEETMNEQENTLDSSTSNAFSIHQNRVDNLVPSLTKALTLISTKESVPTLTKVLTEALSTESVPHLARALALALAQASENNSKLRQGKEQGYSMHQNNFQDINQTLPMDPGHHSIVNESQTQGTPGTLSWSSHLLDHDQPNKNYTYRALGSQAHPSSFHVHSENSLPPVHEILGSQDRCIEKYESFSQKLQTCLEDDMNFSIYYPKQSQTDYYQYSNTHSQVVPHDSSYSQDCRGKPLKEYLLAEPSPFEKKSHHQEPTHSSHFGMGAQYTIQPQGSSQVNTFIETRPYVGTKTQTQTYTMKTPGHFQRERKAKGKPTEKLQGDHVKVPTRTRTRTRTQKKSQAQEHSEYDIPYSKGPLFNIKSEQLFLIQQQQPSQEEPEIKNDYYSQAKNDSSFKVKSPHLPPSIQAQDQTSLHSLNYSEHYDQKNEHEPNTFTSPAYGNNTPSRTYSGTQMHKQINNQEFTNTDRQKYMEMLQTQQKVRMRLEMRARTDIQVKTPLSFDDTGYYGQEDKQKPNTFTLPTYDNTMTSQTYPSSLMHKEVTTREPIHAGSKKPMPLMLQTQRDVAVQKYSQVEIPLSQSSDSMLYKVKDEAQVRFSFSSHSRTYSTPSQGTSPPVSQIIISQAHTYANQCANHWGRQTASSYKHLIGRAQVFGENYIKVYEKSYHDSLNYFIQSYQEPPKNIA